MWLNRIIWQYNVCIAWWIIRYICTTLWQAYNVQMSVNSAKAEFPTLTLFRLTFGECLCATLFVGIRTHVVQPQIGCFLVATDCKMEIFIRKIENFASNDNIFNNEWTLVHMSICQIVISIVWWKHLIAHCEYEYEYECVCSKKFWYLSKIEGYQLFEKWFQT